MWPTVTWLLIETETTGNESVGVVSLSSLIKADNPSRLLSEWTCFLVPGSFQATLSRFPPFSWNLEERRVIQGGTYRGSSGGETRDKFVHCSRWATNGSHSMRKRVMIREPATFLLKMRSSTYLDLVGKAEVTFEEPGIEMMFCGQWSDSDRTTIGQW